MDEHESHWNKRIAGLTPAILLTGAALIAFVASASGQVELGGALDCLMNDGERFTLMIDAERGACDYGADRGTFADGVCLVDKEDALRVTVDEATGAIVIANQETGEERRGVCGPG